MNAAAEGEGARLCGPSALHQSPDRVTGGLVRACTAALLTRDGVRIEAAYRPPLDTARGGLCTVLAHGFTGALERPALRRAAGVFAGFGGVVTFSFRGHGRSGGRSTVGDKEVWDLDAAVRWARRLGHTSVAAVGFSMGGSVVLRQAGLAGRERSGGTGEHTWARVDAVVAVSAPARWYYRGTAPMRRLHWLVTHPAGRVASRLVMRTRIDSARWDPEPLPPVKAVGSIAPTPLLVVHGDRDPYFPLDHPLSLAQAAGPSCELWIEPGYGHAENSADPALLRRIGKWLTSTADSSAERA